ncbi:transketolase, putative [Eimeria tenella]|uniref:Transketolase n=1 Tax=Eimeria tenella TaxID=5802 RepID=U6KUY8_EIMTE|nr:transketolase, putative [Eimeria tenella]CDJ41786.1 transketolase, putative [Eimeria tenella]|eukprot:XP_013232536.1 transketolase, putative [Eimeria tenella]
MVAARRKSSENGTGSEAAHPTKKQVTDAVTPKDEICINTIRGFGADAPAAAKSGHPGAPIGCAPMAHCLFGHVMKYYPKDPRWFNRDRFVLSNGHACVLQYTMLHLAGYDLSIDDIKKFRKLHSKTPGHPEVGHAPGIEVTTGPLGQGISNSVGLAIAAHHISAKYNRPNFNLFDNYIYCICGDGCLQEGVASEACSLAGHLGLGRLIVLYDSNKITIDGDTSLSFTENVLQRFNAYGWHTQTVKDGDRDISGILQAIRRAKAVTDKPSLIEIKTTIGWGSQNEGTEKVHGAPLSADDIKQLKEKLGLNPNEDFHVPEDTRKFYAGVAARNKAEYDAWQTLFTKYGEAYPKEKQELGRMFGREVSEQVETALKDMAKAAADTPASTRVLSGKALNAIKDFMPELIGGSADLTTSNETRLKGETAFSPNPKFGSYADRYIHFGVREHGMAAICNGLYAYGCFRPFGATFLNFLTYAWGAVRLAALSKLGCLFISTHDSIELGEDGPTHQAVEVIPLCRALPNMLCARPADANEVAAAYITWLRHATGPTVICLCRGGIPPIAGSSVEKALKGGYIVSDFAKSGKPQVIIAGSGSELQFCVEAKKLLTDCDVRVVSMMCWDTFEEQPEAYKEEVLMLKERKEGKVLCAYVEAAATLGWDRYFDVHIGMKGFGASAPRADIWKAFGFTGENVAKSVREALKK